jgi:hypothetical protein
MMKAKGAASFGRLAVVLLGMTVAIAGCHKVTGGGWIAGVNGGKATFGFQAQCHEEEVLPGVPGFAFFEGQVQYQDKGANVGFHGDINANNFAFFPFGGAPRSCKDFVDFVSGFGVPVNGAEMTGECVSHPGGVTGTFKVTVVDNGKPGPSAGDEITVTTPNYFTLPIFDEEGNIIGEEVVQIGLPCTADGLPYSNSGLVGGGNIAMPGHNETRPSKK